MIDERFFLEIIAFSDRADEFRAIDCEVLACSTDSHYSHFAWYDIGMQLARVTSIFSSIGQRKNASRAVWAR